MAWSPIAHTAAGGTGNTATTGGIDTTGANLLIASVSAYAVNPTISDSNGNTWTNLTTRTGGSGTKTRLFYCTSPIVGSGHTFTGTATGGFPSVTVAAFSGAAASPFDAETGSGTTTPGSITPAGAGELFVTSLSYITAGNTPTVDSGFTRTDFIDYLGSTRMGAALGYLINAGSSAESPTWSPSTSFAENATAQAAFKAAAGVSGRLSRVSPLEGLGGSGQMAFNPSLGV